jgi:hypothetical protein
MAATIDRPTDSTGPLPDDAAPDVRAPADHVALLATQTRKDRQLWRGSVIGAGAGFVVTAALVVLIGALRGVEPASALGLGAFIGLWGGCGFGLMMGGVFAMQAIERRDRRITE